MSFVMARIEGDSWTVTAELFRPGTFSSGSQLLNLGIGDCLVTSRPNSAEVQRVSWCEPKYPMPDLPLKSSV